MPDHDDRIIRQVLSDVANALQAAQPLASRQRVVAQRSAEDAGVLETSINRAVLALKTLHPQEEE